MSRTLTIELPNDVYEPLSRKALEAGRRPEDLASDWLAEAARRAVGDPLLQLAGVFAADVTDIGDRHDEYIGQGLVDELHGRSDA